MSDTNIVIPARLLALRHPVRWEPNRWFVIVDPSDERFVELIWSLLKPLLAEGVVD